jgi:hypothetical protein
MGGGIGHPPTATRRTEPPTLAREGDGAIVAACIAVDAKESVGEDAALEIAADLAFDEAGDGRPHRSCAGEEGLELVADDLMEKGLLGLVTFVPVDGGGSGGTGSRRRRGRSLSCPLRSVRAWGRTRGNETAETSGPGG